MLKTILYLVIAIPVILFNLLIMGSMFFLLIFLGELTMEFALLKTHSLILSGIAMTSVVMLFAFFLRKLLLHYAEMLTEISNELFPDKTGE